MIVGQVEEVGNELEAVVVIPARDANGDLRDLRAVIDTGFTEELTMSRRDINTLGLPFWGNTTLGLGNESDIAVRFFKGHVEWHGELRRVAVIENPGVPLIGMTLLEGSRLTMDVAVGGEVNISPL